MGYVNVLRGPQPARGHAGRPRKRRVRNRTQSSKLALRSKHEESNLNTLLKFRIQRAFSSLEAKFRTQRETSFEAKVRVQRSSFKLAGQVSDRRWQANEAARGLVRPINVTLHK